MKQYELRKTRVILQPELEAEKTTGGIVIPKAAAKPPLRFGIVKQKGSEVVADEIKENARVGYSGGGQEYDDHLIVDEDQIWIIQIKT